MAATFNAPLASVLLAVELLLFEWRPRSLVPVAAAVVRRHASARPLLGAGPLFPCRRSRCTSRRRRTCSAWSPGVISGLLAVLATVLVYASEDAFARLPIHWMWWPAIGGLVIGVGGLFVPQALGVGYDVIGAELDRLDRPRPGRRHPRREDADLVAVARLRAPPAASWRRCS